MKKPNQHDQSGFDSLPDKGKLEIIKRYVDKYKGSSSEALIDWALKCNVAGELAINSNYRL